MKKLILFELTLLFLATTFVTDSPPPGWYQQTLPVTGVVLSDIFFLDSSIGWTIGRRINDTAFVFKTTNGGNNWSEQYKAYAIFSEIQFLDANTGYIAGDLGFGAVFKTTNGGVNWNVILNSGDGYQNLFFVNKDTGWISDEYVSGAGLQKTTDGGLSWTQQLSGSFRPTNLFFLNKDTGWVACQNVNLYRTTNGGSVWTLQFVSEYTIESLFFFDKFKGWMRGGYLANTIGVAYTTDGGFTWTNAQGEVGGFDIKFVTDSIGYSGMINNKITKSTDGGKIWGYQISPVYSNLSTWMFRGDTLNGWAGRSGIVHTTDGGGPIFLGVQQINNEVPSSYKLYQNYPNPFNPVTKIKYEITKSSEVILKIYNIEGKEVTTLVNKKQTAGIYETEFDARLQNGQGSAYSSGIYFYSLTVDGRLIETRKMVLIK